MTPLVFRHTHKWGNARYYPANPAANDFVEMFARKSLTEKNILILRKLGSSRKHFMANGRNKCNHRCYQPLTRATQLMLYKMAPRTKSYRTRR